MPRTTTGYAVPRDGGFPRKGESAIGPMAYFVAWPRMDTSVPARRHRSFTAARVLAHRGTLTGAAPSLAADPQQGR
jgi:hypothetical protein